MEETPSPRVTALPIAALRPAPWYPRVAGLDEEHARMLAECGSKLPPILVRRSMHVIDGAHRIRAAQLRGQIEVDAIVVDDSESEACVRAVVVNTRHGLPLTLRDRKAAAAHLLLVCPAKSDRAIAELAGLSGKTVGVLRRATADLPQPGARVGRDGRVRAVAASRRTFPGVRQEVPGPAKAADAVRLAAVAPVPTAAEPSPPPPLTFPAHRQPHDILANLMRDPSLRYTEAGRGLLRGLNQHSAAFEQSRATLLATVPPHCLPAVARLAKSFAADWQELGDLAEQRMHSSTRKAG